MLQIIENTRLNTQVVSAKELHKILDIQTRFDIWIERRINEYGFIEKEDYVCLDQKRSTQREDGQKGKTSFKEYVLTLDMAKELAMVEKNEKGRQARRYFIGIEKEYQKLLANKVGEFEHQVKHLSYDNDSKNRLIAQKDRTIAFFEEKIAYHREDAEWQYKLKISEQEVRQVQVNAYNRLSEDYYKLLDVVMSMEKKR